MRKKFLEAISTMSKEMLVYIDESGAEDNICRDHGWSVKGNRCYGTKVYQHTRRVSMIAGLCDNRMIAPLIFEGNCDGRVFEAYVENVLVTELKQEQIVIMDNISFHKKPSIKEAIEAAGCKILFLPTYSPDMNPIEHYWFKVKNEIKKVAHQFENFFDAVYHVLHSVTSLIN